MTSWAPKPAAETAVSYLIQSRGHWERSAVPIRAAMPAAQGTAGRQSTRRRRSSTKRPTMAPAP